MTNIIIISVCSVLSIIFFINSKKIANIFNLYDIPNKRKIHKKPIPLVGGVILLFVITIFYFANYFLNVLEMKNSFLFILGLHIITIVGVIDDKSEIKPNYKLAIFGMFFLIFFFINDYLIIDQLRFSSFKFEMSLGFFGILFTILCSLLLINSINMSDGINGLSAMLQIIIFFFLIYFNHYNNNLLNINTNFSQKFNLFSLFYIMILSIFLFFNLFEKVFLGDAGTFLLSFILINSLLLNYKYLEFFYPENILMLLWIPGLDMLRVFIIRIKNKKNPFNPDQNHFHHILKKIFKKNINCLSYYSSLVVFSNILVIKYPQHSLTTLILTSIVYFVTINIANKKNV